MVKQCKSLDVEVKLKSIHQQRESTLPLVTNSCPIELIEQEEVAEFIILKHVGILPNIGTKSITN